MLDALTITATDETDSLPLGAIPQPLSEEQARAYLANCLERPSVRACAAAFGWNKSRAERFLKRLDAEQKPPIVPASKTNTENAPLAEMIRTLREAGASDETIGAAVETIAKCASERPLAQAGGRDKSELDESLRMFEADNPDLLTHDQPATCVYLNPYNQVVIRQNADTDEPDPFVRFDPHHIPKLIARLQQLAREATA